MAVKLVHAGKVSAEQESLKNGVQVLVTEMDIAVNYNFHKRLRMTGEYLQSFFIYPFIKI
jgi:GH35 family endo-1,4-beta-xylanase